MGNTCKPMAISFQCMTKSTTIKKIKSQCNFTSKSVPTTYILIWVPLNKSLNYHEIEFYKYFKEGIVSISKIN